MRPPSPLDVATARRDGLFAVAEAFQRNLPGAERPYPRGVLANPSTWYTTRELDLREALAPHWTILEHALDAACYEVWVLTPEASREMS